MGRYTGPKHRLARREGINIIDKPSASLARRLNVPPGNQGRRNKRRLSEYGQQLREKQKAKVMYGLLERQFRKLVNTVSQQKGDTEELLLSLLERRLDNIVYRLGLSTSRGMSRQLVTHGHVVVNGKKMSIPSYQVQEDDVITIDAIMLKNPDIMKSLEEEKELIAFLEKKGAVGKLKRMPKPDDVHAPFNTRQIIEYYSR